MTKRSSAVQENVHLAKHTTLQVGGEARFLAQCHNRSELRDSLALARSLDLPTLVLGGGSNMLVADSGFEGVCIQPALQGISIENATEQVQVQAEAGWVWDDLVAWTVEESLMGLECLSGIPGNLGAAPIQNIGAYGQEVAEVLTGVEVMVRHTGELEYIPAEQCGFGYRNSRFKGPWRDRYVVTRVDFALKRGRQGLLRYPDLQRYFGLTPGEKGEADLAQVRQAVLAVRRNKSMVIDPQDPNHRSAGSFFVNPVLPLADVAEVRRRWERHCESTGRDITARPMPLYPVGDSEGKLSAAWLIESAGFPRGFHLGRAGLSTRHTLALINRGGASAQEIITLAERIRHRVRDNFGVTLQPEPVLVGFSQMSGPFKE